MAGLSFNERKAVLAAAIGIREWNIDDISDDKVTYTADSEVNPNIRGTFQRTYTIDTKNRVTLGTPQQVFKRTVYEPLVVVSAFSLDESIVEFSEDGETVYRYGKVFEAGSYEDKDFEITEDELAQAAAEFRAVANNIGHMPTILDGKLGQLVSVEVKGKDLIGKVAIPKWLHDTAGDEPIKCSLEWLKNSKRIVGNALVINPRIPDAQLVAAFSAANTQKGGISMPENKKPNIVDRVKAFFGDKGLPDELKDIEQAEFTETKPESVATPNEEVAKFKAELESSRAETAALRSARLRDEAEKFADRMIKENKATPAEKDGIVSTFTKLAEVDSNAGVACFSADGRFSQGDSLKVYCQSIEARTPHNLTNEEIVTLSATGGKTDEEELNRARAANNLPVKEVK